MSNENKKKKKKSGKEAKYSSQQGRRDIAVSTYKAQDSAKKSYNVAISTALLVFIMFSVSIAFIIKASSYSPPTRYVLVDKERRIIDNLTLTEFHVKPSEVAQWGIEAISKSFHYDFTTVESHVGSVKKYYTQRGYQQFAEQFNSSSDIVLVKKEKAISQINKIDPPEIVGSGTINGKAAIKFKTRIIQTFLAGGGIIRVVYDVEFVVVREDIKNFEDGMAIESLIRVKVER